MTLKRTTVLRRILFAPLTGLQVQSTRVEGAVLVVSVALSVNLASLTIEQVVGKRRDLVGQMVDQTADQVGYELTSLGFREAGVALLKQEAAEAKKHDAEWYNVDANFREAVDVVLDAKALVLGPARLEWIAGLPIAEAQEQAAFVLESARSQNAEVVRAVLPVLRKHQAMATAKYDRIGLVALHQATGGGGEVGRTKRVESHESWTGMDQTMFTVHHVSSRGLFLADKGWCSGAPLKEWMGLTVDGSGRVTELQLKGCGLKGSLPPQLALLTQMVTLDLRDNPELTVPVGARELGLLDMTGQVHATDRSRVQALLQHAALPEAKQREAKEDQPLIQKHGPDGPALWQIYKEGGGTGWKWERDLWFQKEDDVSKWKGVKVDEKGRVTSLSFKYSGLTSLSKSVEKLAALQMLDVSTCDDLPSLPELGGCKALRHLHLPVWHVVWHGGKSQNLTSLSRKLDERVGHNFKNMRRLGPARLDVATCLDLMTLPEIGGLGGREVRIQQTLDPARVEITIL